ncbi:MAG: DPP IV N-terminal domain-containing protein, partial [Priestia megaterium]
MNHLKKRTVTIEDLYELKSVYNPQISPDGKSVVYTVRETKKIENAYETQLFMLDIETKETKQLTYYKGNNHSPAWSPDGKWIAFLSDRSQAVQLYLLAATGGEAEALTNLEKGVSNP